VGTLEKEKGSRRLGGHRFAKTISSSANFPDGQRWTTIHPRRMIPWQHPPVRRKLRTLARSGPQPWRQTWSQLGPLVVRLAQASKGRDAARRAFGEGAQVGVEARNFLKYEVRNFFGCCLPTSPKVGICLAFWKSWSCPGMPESCSSCCTNNLPLFFNNYATSIGCYSC